MSQPTVPNKPRSTDPLVITAIAAAILAFLIPITTRPDWGPVSGLLQFACSALFSALAAAWAWRRRHGLERSARKRAVLVGAVTVVAAAMLSGLPGDGLPALLVLLVGAGYVWRIVGSPAMLRPVVAAVAVVVSVRLELSVAAASPASREPSAERMVTPP